MSFIDHHRPHFAIAEAILALVLFHIGLFVVGTLWMGFAMADAVVYDWDVNPERYDLADSDKFVLSMGMYLTLLVAALVALAGITII